MEEWISRRLKEGNLEFQHLGIQLIELSFLTKLIGQHHSKFFDILLIN
jgi:hypothetical protein